MATSTRMANSVGNVPPPVTTKRCPHAARGDDNVRPTRPESAVAGLVGGDRSGMIDGRTETEGGSGREHGGERRGSRGHAHRTPGGVARPVPAPRGGDEPRGRC